MLLPQDVLELNPQRPTVHQELGNVYIVQGRNQEALQEMQQEPDLIWRLWGEAVAYHALGKKQQSDAALADLVAKFQNDAPFNVAEVYAFRGQNDLAFEWLERAYGQRDSGLQELKGDPFLKNLETDSRYIPFLQKMHLPLN